MDRTDMPSNEMQDRIDEETFELVAEAIAARDAEWVAELDKIRNEMLACMNELHPDYKLSYAEAANAFSILKVRMTGEE